MKKIIILSILVIFFSLMITYSLENLTLEYIIDISQDSAENTYILQKEALDNRLDQFSSFLAPTYTLIKINKNGESINTIKLPKDKGKLFSEYDNLDIDSDGNMYLHRTYKNSDDYYVTSEEILKISVNGKKAESIYSLDYSGANEVEYALISKTYIINHHMFFIKNDSIDSNKIDIGQINLLNNEMGIVKSLQMDPTLFVRDLLYLENSQIIFSTIKGELYIYTDENIEKIEYENMPKEFKPSKLYVYGNNNIAFFDSHNFNVVSLDIEHKKYNIIRKHNEIIDNQKNLKYEDANLISIDINKNISGSIGLNNEYKRFIFIEDENGILVFDDIKEDMGDQIQTFLKYLLLFGIIAFLIGFLINIYGKSEGSLIIKFSGILLPLVMLIPIISLSVSFSYFTNLSKNDLYAELYHISRERTEQLNTNSLKMIKGLEDYGNPDYQELSNARGVDSEGFNELGRKTYDRWYYTVIYRVMGDEIRVVEGDDIEFWSTTTYLYGENGNQIYLNAVSGNKTILGDSADSSGEWVLAVTPIYDENENIIGLFEVGTGQETYTYFIQDYYGKLLIMNISIVFLIMLLMIFVIYRMILPLKNLSESASYIMKGESGTTVDFKSHDEIGSLASIFNKMSLFIKDYITELKKLNKVYFKFIPLKFFEILDKKSIADVELGNYTNQEMTIVYINTANYFELVKGLSSKEQLVLLNKLFEEYSNAIHVQNGLVGEFKNAGVIALFKEESEAMNTASMIRQRINEIELNVKSTISVHCGEVLLGIVGDENRMTTTVISEYVNQVVSIEKYANKFNSGVLVTELILSNLNDININIRYIGDFINENNGNLTKVYEWIDTIDLEYQNDFFKSLEFFEEGIKYYMANEFNEAKKLFIKVIKSNSKDLISKEYLYKCEKLLNDGNINEKPLGRF